jgi:hypothetical protein
MGRKFFIISVTFCFLLGIFGATGYGANFLKNTGASVKKNRNGIWTVSTNWKVDYNRVPNKYNPDALYVKVEVISSVDSGGRTFKRIHDRREYNAGRQKGGATISKSQLKPQKRAQYFWPRHFWVLVSLLYNPKSQFKSMQSKPKVMETTWVYAGPIRY